MKRTTLPLLAALAVLLLSSPAFSQATYHVFPQFADGRTTDGSYYRSTLTILPWTGSSTPQCEFMLYGMTTTFETGASGYYFSAEIPLTSMMSARTNGTQPLQTGYATLTCSSYVYANVLFTYYSADNRKIGEATIFSTPEAYFFRMPFDVRGGVRQAFAIANNTGFNRGYVISLVVNGAVQQAYVVVPAQRNLAKFVDEILTVSPETIGLLVIQSTDYSYFSTVGMRVTGGVFTTIPPGN